MGRIIVLFSALILVSCIGQRMEKQAEEDEQIILDYIQKQNLDAQKDESGLYYVVDQEGSGERPKLNSQVTVVYKGFLDNGTVFDKTDSEGATFGLSQVIEGWQIGIPKFKEGGSGLLMIPSALGYGTSDRPGIPANSVLFFEVELLEVN